MQSGEPPLKINVASVLSQFHRLILFDWSYSLPSMLLLLQLVLLKHDCRSLGREVEYIASHQQETGNVSCSLHQRRDCSLHEWNLSITGQKKSGSVHNT